MSFLQNITFRRPRTQSLNEKNEEDILSKTSTTIDIHDTTTGSLPNISNDSDVDERVQELMEQIDKLKTKLQSADQEIVNLSLENTELKRTIQALESKHDIYKKATKNLSSTILNSPIRGTPKKTVTPLRAVTSKKKSPILLKQKVTNKESSDIINCSNTQGAKVDEPNMRSHQLSTHNKTTDFNSTLPKIAILSTNKNTDTLATAKRIFTRYNICHYLSTNCSLIRMVHSLKSKIRDFSMNDYCVIVIGEADFEFTNNYFDIVINLRKIILENMHTNIILCVPTFKCGKYTNMFNSRIETFNSLLNLDVLTHQHAYLIDSNKNLSYDFDMFDYKTGNVNKYGMQIIFDDVLSLVNDIEKYYKKVNEEKTKSKRQTADLFRE
jgi:cell division septum initiation protein DivIVA